MRGVGERVGELGKGRGVNEDKRREMSRIKE